jgi:hypothetical protein
VSATARFLAAAVTIAGWIALSNHCVFAALASKPIAERSSCPFHSNPAKPKTPAPLAQCCKILRATAVASAKIPSRAVVDLPHVDVASDAIAILSTREISLRSAALDTGPPGRIAVAELIVSMRAHAPPLFA